MSHVQGQPLPGQPLPAHPLPGDEREGAELRVHAVGAIGQVPAAEWDACANPAPFAANALAPSLQVDQAGDERSALEAQRLDQENVYNPFISHDFLSALEASSSVGGRSGWQVSHLIVKTADGAPLAPAPCDVKRQPGGE